MKKEEIQLLFSQFEQVSCTLNDVECWSARDLCTLLGYKLWQNFTKVIDKAKDACANKVYEAHHLLVPHEGVASSTYNHEHSAEEKEPTLYVT